MKNESEKDIENTNLLADDNINHLPPIDKDVIYNMTSDEDDESFNQFVSAKQTGMKKSMVQGNMQTSNQVKDLETTKNQQSKEEQEPKTLKANSQKDLDKPKSRHITPESKKSNFQSSTELKKANTVLP